MGYTVISNFDKGKVDGAFVKGMPYEGDDVKDLEKQKLVAKDDSPAAKAAVVEAKEKADRLAKRAAKAKKKEQVTVTLDEPILDSKEPAKKAPKGKKAKSKKVEVEAEESAA